MSVRPIPLPFAAFLLSAVGLLSLGGCYHRSPYGSAPYGGGYGQPMYAPPQNMAPMAPGTLYIPESNAPPYDPAAPTNTYDQGYDPDDFQRSPDGGGDGQFYRREDDSGGVPQPREPGNGGNMFDQDLNNPGL